MSPLTTNPGTLLAAEMHSESLAREVSDLLVSRLSTQPRAIVITGSFARNEGSVLITGNRIRVLGDMEYMVVFAPGVNRGLLQRELDGHAKQLRTELKSRGIECDLEFRAIEPQYFYSLTPQIFGYELLTHGRAVWGDPSVLSAVPKPVRESIPQWDAWRMLNNRIIEQLEWSDQIEAYSRDQLDRLYYQLIKCHIDLATTLLIFAGRYADTYAARADALCKWAFEMESVPRMKFLHFIAQRVAACTAFKLDPNNAPVPLGVRVRAADAEVFRADLRAALIDFVPLVHEIWRWEAVAFGCCSTGADVPDETVLRAVLARQPLKEKIRGWAKLALMPSVREQPAFARRLLPLISRGSPRYLVYAVAAQLYFKLPGILTGGVADEVVEPLERLLPVHFAQNNDECRPWWRLRADVISSWHAFLRTHFA